jgi:outer membrane protein W
MSCTRLVCLALVAIGCWSSGWSEGGKSVLRVGGAYVMPSGDLTESGSFTGEDLGDGTMLAFEGTLTIEPQDTYGFTVGYEYSLIDFLGFDFVLLNATSDVDGRLLGTYWINDSNTGDLIDTGPLDETDEIGDVTFTPVTVGINFHLTPGSKLDFFVAPVVGYVFYGDLDVYGDKVSMEDGFTYGATVGLDIPLGERWVVNGALRYLSTETKIDEPGFESDSLDVSPVVFQVAMGYRF